MPYKITFTIAALLFYGQLSFAGSNSRHGAQAGFVRPMVGAFAGAFGKVCSYFQEADTEEPWGLIQSRDDHSSDLDENLEDAEYLWECMDDDDSDSEEATDTKNEAPEDEAAQGGIEPVQLSELEQLPDEILWGIFRYLDKESLAKLCLTSRHLSAVAQGVLEYLKTEEEIKNVKKRSRSYKLRPKRKSASQIAALLTTKNLSTEQRSHLLAILLGENNQGGLIKETSYWTCDSVINAVGTIL